MYGLGFKIHKLFKNRETFLKRLPVFNNIENASCGVCSSRICLPNAKPAKIQTKRKQGFKRDFSFHNTSITLLSPFNEKCFCFKTFLMFWLSVKNFAFCYLAFVSSGFFRLVCGSKCPVNESELLCGYMAYDLRLFAHSSSSPKKKMHKKVVEYSTQTDPQLTWGGNLTDFNFLRFCKK